ncbi:Mobile element protein [Pseudomonas synxantha]|uniref:Mobile element protein n=1 Tax=Pseudomonas synxantha TaxID=47883 RepID=A0A3G7UBX4_9PSED|nr:Mobile element protein [Pseudomonas synxantha]
MQRVETLDYQVDALGKTVETMGKRIHCDQTLIEKLTQRFAKVGQSWPKLANRSEQLIPSRPACLMTRLISISRRLKQSLKACRHR